MNCCQAIWGCFFLPVIWLGCQASDGNETAQSTDSAFAQPQTVADTAAYSKPGVQPRRQLIQLADQFETRATFPVIIDSLGWDTTRVIANSLIADFFPFHYDSGFYKVYHGLQVPIDDEVRILILHYRCLKPALNWWDVHIDRKGSVAIWLANDRITAIMPEAFFTTGAEFYEDGRAYFSHFSTTIEANGEAIRQISYSYTYQESDELEAESYSEETYRLHNGQPVLVNIDLLKQTDKSWKLDLTTPGSIPKNTLPDFAVVYVQVIPDKTGYHRVDEEAYPSRALYSAQTAHLSWIPDEWRTPYPYYIVDSGPDAELFLIFDFKYAGRKNLTGFTGAVVPYVESENKSSDQNPGTPYSVIGKTEPRLLPTGNGLSYFELQWLDSGKTLFREISRIAEGETMTVDTMYFMDAQMAAHLPPMKIY